MGTRLPMAFDGCFGTLHPAAGKTGVVICGAQGYDDLCSRRALALLADDCADAGLPTLRFDYHGTGQSAGSETDPDRVATWIANIDAAIAWLLRETGVETVTLVGFRLGALLAARTASQNASVHRLVLIAAPQSGRALLRELKLQSKLYTVDTGSGPDDLDVAGFPMPPAMAADIATLSLSCLRQAELAALIVFGPIAGSVTDDLAGRGCRVERQGFDGLAELVSDPIRSLSAADPFAAVLTALKLMLPKLATLEPTIAPAHGHGATSLPEACLDGIDWHEDAIRFGEGRRLFGILCRPRLGPVQGPAHGETILFLNGGANPSIGWARMTVPLARSLAAKGYASFRFDVSGIGESQALDASQPVILYAPAFLDDVSQALDWLAARGHAGIVAYGACSGAHIAYHAAVADGRIEGIVLANLLRFRITAEEAGRIGGAVSFRSTANYLQRMRQRDGWTKLLAGGRTKLEGLVAEYRRRWQTTVASNVAFLLFRIAGVKPEERSIFGGFAALANRGTRVLILYGDHDDGLDELAIHLGRGGSMLNGFAGMEVALLPNADHNLTSRQSQAQLARHLSGFLASFDRSPVAIGARSPVDDSASMSGGTRIRRHISR